MAAEETRPDWSNLPDHLLGSIGKRTRDAVTGLAAFRSVCRAWRAAVAPAPRLLVPRAGPSEDALVMPLSHGWAIVVDARDDSCHLSHLATGATAALPRLTAVRRAGSDDVVTLPVCLHRPDVHPEIRTNYYLMFTDFFRFAVHVPPAAAPPTTAAAAAASMTIMMANVMLGSPGTGMFCCRPGDAAWTSVNRISLFPIPARISYMDLAYHDGKMFGLDISGRMTVFDAATLQALCIVQSPPATPNIAKKRFEMFTDREESFNFVHLVALPSKLVLVTTHFKSSQPPSKKKPSRPRAPSKKPSRPVAFDVFELGSTAEGLAWLKVRDAGNYELFLDGYHATYRENMNGGNNSGTRIYYVHDVATLVYIDDELRIPPAAYCYSMQDKKLECIYMPPEDFYRCSTKPSWFVP